MKSVPGNYRPVSLTSHIGKLMEKIIKEEITSHLDRYDLLNDTQHGFMRSRSCLTNLLTYITTLLLLYCSAFEQVVLPGIRRLINASIIIIIIWRV